MSCPGNGGTVMRSGKTAWPQRTELQSSGILSLASSCVQVVRLSLSTHSAAASSLYQVDVICCLG